MHTIPVKTVTLPPMTVACSRAFGESPEHEAWATLRAWAQPRGFLDDPAAHPVYGFNNPNPAEGQTRYGYEFWIKVPSNTPGTATVRVRPFAGGVFATADCHLFRKPTIRQACQSVLQWIDAHDYTCGPTHELEHHKNPLANPDDLDIEFMIPFEEKAAASVRSG
ncbi:MAG: GyrI-like domain-containing protein [Planctomycetota bacterium]